MDLGDISQGFEHAQPLGATFSSVPAANPIRLLLVDDKVIMREGVRALLEQEPGLHVIGQAASVAEALALEVRPDVVVTDVVLPDARGHDVVVGLRRRYASAAIFVLVDPDGADEIIGADQATGIRGYALKTATPAEFLAGLRTVAQGVQYVHPSLRPGGARPQSTAPGAGESAYTASGATEAPGDRPDEAILDVLTDKEREVMRLLVLGHTNAEIAVLSSVSLRTVEARRARVLQKLGVRTRADLVRVAHGLI
jgi:two-component system response regulator NreC